MSLRVSSAIYEMVIIGELNKMIKEEEEEGTKEDFIPYHRPISFMHDLIQSNTKKKKIKKARNIWTHVTSKGTMRVKSKS